MKIVTLSIIFLSILTNYAYAYLDPGTGSFLIQAIIAFFAAALAFTTGLWLKIKLFLGKLFGSSKFSRKDKEKKTE
tara:strand:- start:1015 stop:1242 length:228 start_codon:yes stop_codon:yes gene_type:complete